MKKHSGYGATCDRCGRRYCPECESACPNCCIHNDCIAVKERDAALEALEEAQGLLRRFHIAGSLSYESGKTDAVGDVWRDVNRILSKEGNDGR